MRDLARQLDVETPISDAVAEILAGETDVDVAIAELLARPAEVRDPIPELKEARVALFVLVCIDKPNALDLRMATREAHFAYANGLPTGAIRLTARFSTRTATWRAR